MFYMIIYDYQVDSNKGMNLNCMYCLLLFINFFDFRYYLMIYEKVSSQNFFCFFCGSVFFIQDDFDNYVEKVYLDEIRNKCFFCLEVFGNLYDLYVYMSFYESDIKG